MFVDRVLQSHRKNRISSTQTKDEENWNIHRSIKIQNNFVMRIYDLNTLCRSQCICIAHSLLTWSDHKIMGSCTDARMECINFMVFTFLFNFIIIMHRRHQKAKLLCKIISTTTEIEKIKKKCNVISLLGSRADAYGRVYAKRKTQTDIFVQTKFRTKNTQVIALCCMHLPRQHCNLRAQVSRSKSKWDTENGISFLKCERSSTRSLHRSLSLTQFYLFLK